MAEIVQQRMEAMAEEIEEMKRIKLYTQNELSYILKSRKEFEYKLIGVSKSVKDFEEYILHEKLLLKQISNRRSKGRIAERKEGIEFKILRRIKNLYETALQRFPNNFKLYLAYFKFCKQSNFTTSATHAVENMIKNCSDQPEVWQVAAGWYAHDRNDLSTALTYINKGLTLHKNSQILYREAIRLVLSQVKNEDASNDNDNVKKCLKYLQTYVRFICDCVNDVSYLIEILELVEPYQFFNEIQGLIINKLTEKFSEREIVWHTLAQREKKSQQGSQQQLLACFSKYEQGISKVCHGEKTDLWSKYLDCLVEAQIKEKNLTGRLKVALEKAANDGCLSERYYVKWLELVPEDKALDILEKGTMSLPSSVDLWKLRLRFAILSEKKALINRIFQEGVQNLKEKSLALWTMKLRYYGLMGRDLVIEEIYKEGIRQPEPISTALKPKYIEWLGQNRGINEARQQYSLLANQKPYCKDLHLAMSKMESTEIDHNFDKWGSVYELACRQFGEEDVDVWINHILFYLHFNKTANVNEKVQMIRMEALEKLSPLLQNTFKDKYDKALAMDLPEQPF